jgi:hypothetical protein
MTSIEPRTSNVPTIGVPDRRKPAMERIIESLATGLGGGVGWLAETGVLFAAFALIWVAVGIGIVASAGTVDEAWRAIGALPLVVQAIAWVLLLPVMLGLWVWESNWPLIVRLVVVVGIAGWNLLIFLPRSLRASA